MDSTFTRYKSKVLRIADKFVRYENHMAFITTYVKANKIPKGFRLKFHNNMELNVEGILHKCSIKIMKKTLAFYKTKIKEFHKNIAELDKEIRTKYPELAGELLIQIFDKADRIHSQIEAKHKKKIIRDHLDANRAMHSIRETKTRFEKELSESVEKEIDLTSGVKIPSHDPILLTENQEFQKESYKSLLAKGPSFVPTPFAANWNELHQDFERFANLIRKEVFFHNTEAQVQTESTSDVPRKPSNWKPPKANIPEAEVFLKQVEKEIFEDVAPKRIKSNLTKDERVALKSCKQMLNDPQSKEVIRIQDKGNKFVLVDKEIDIFKAEQQIKKSSMKKLENDLTQDIIQKVQDWCEKWKEEGSLPSEWCEYIVNKDATAAKNAPLYKTHKSGTPVRLLTSGCNSATEGLSLFVEKKCAPLAKQLKSRIRDTGHLLEIIDELNEKGIPDGAVLLSLDIENMFPSIDNRRGMETIRKKLEEEEDFPVPTDLIIEAIEIILTNNNSTFNRENYIQMNGTATGAKNSCSYSDLALEPVDKEIYRAQLTIFKEILAYARFRDDCFLVWLGDKDLLSRFVYFVNILDPSLKFTVEFGGMSIEFMDLLIKIENGKLTTSVYSKPTDGHLYLHYDSCHPKNTKLAVEQGTALRLRRICSSDEEYKNRSTEYMAYLAARGHKNKDIVGAFDAVANMSRQNARVKKTTVDDKPKKHRFFTKYNPHHPKIQQVIKKNEHLLQTNATLAQIFPIGSFQIVNKRERNLKELVSRADPYTIKLRTEGGFKTCGEWCDSCSTFAKDCSSFKCQAIGRQYKMTKMITCTTPNVIYLAQCGKCKIQGVGSTTKWKPRLRNYKSWVKNRIRQCRIGNHFIDNAECRGVDNKPWENMRFTIIDCVDNFQGLPAEKIENELLKKEKFWIRTLLTYHHGLNSSHDLNRANRCEREKMD